MCEIAAHHRELVCSRSINSQAIRRGAAVMVANLSAGARSKVPRWPKLSCCRIEATRTRAGEWGCVEAVVPARLRCMRAKDRQVFALQVDAYLRVGSPLDATSEARLIELAEDVLFTFLVRTDAQAQSWKGDGLAWGRAGNALLIGSVMAALVSPA